jgi:hypothetical protein
VRAAWGGLPLLSALSLGCSDPDTSGHLTKTQNDHEVELRAEWTYTSFEVDVDLTVTTLVGSDSCASTGTLVVDDALSAKRTYSLPPTDCSELELTDGGDIVLQDDPTGHDWVNERLSVDTDAEVITLGPATLKDADGNDVSYRFTLSSPPCPDAPSCKCGILRRVAGTMTLDLSLGRRC